MDTDEKAFRVNYGDRTSKPPVFTEVKVAVLGCCGNVTLFVRSKLREVNISKLTIRVARL